MILKETSVEWDAAPGQAASELNFDRKADTMPQPAAQLEYVTFHFTSLPMIIEGNYIQV